MNALRTFGVSVFVLTLAGCATSVPINDRQNPTGVGVHIKVRAPIALFSTKVDAVYFVSVDSNGNLNQYNFIRSTFSRDGRVYLLNIEPGEYAIVGTYFYSRGQYISYLSDDSIEKTRIKVTDGKLTFIGDIVLDTHVGLDGADSAQIRYANLISPGGTNFKLFSNDYHYRSEIYKFDNSMESRNTFIEKAKKDLAGGGWESLFR